MTRPNRTIFALVAIIAACTSKKDISAAKHSLYDTEFAVVYSAALDATRHLYPNLDDNPGPGKIQTAWHQVQFSNCPSSGSTCDDAANAMTLSGSPNGGMNTTPQGMQSQSSPNGNGTGSGSPTRLAYKRYFVRFDVSVLGGRPWRVKVVGHASEWDPGAAMPVEMRGPAKPAWLEPRIDSLRVEIYKHIRQFAVPAHDDDVKPAEEELPKTDPASFKGVPAGAAKRLATVKDALAKRDYEGLRPQLADDIEWSLGGGTGADTAMAMWQADPAQLDAMFASLASCGVDNDKQVSCPQGKAAPGQYQLRLEPRGDDWKITSFVKAE